MARTATTDRTAAPAARVPLLWALGVVLVLAGLLSWRQETSLDLGFHVATGRYILSTGHWPSNDPFTYTLGDRPYVTMNSLFQILAALADRIGGMAGMSVLRLLVVLGAVAITWAHALRRGVRSPSLLILGFTLGLFAWSLRFFIRPELLSFLIAAAFLYLLRRHAEDGRRRWLWILVPLQLIWTWSHTLSLLGPALVGLYAVCGLLGRRRGDRLPWIVAALCLVALFANPYGIAGVRDLWLLRTRLAAGSVWRQTISELVSPFAMSGAIPWPVRWFEVLLVVTPIAVAIRFRGFSLFDLVTLVFFGVLAATAVRNTGFFVLGTLPLLLAAAQEIADRLRARWRNAAARLGQAPLVVSSSLALLLCWTVASGCYYLHDNVDYNVFGAGWSPSRFPIRCVDRIERDRLQGPVYNVINFGGYMIDRLWPRLKVFIDTRLEVMDERFFVQSFAIQQGPGWSAMMRRYDPNLVLVDHVYMPLLMRLFKDPEWSLIEVDGVGALFLRKRTENLAITTAAEEEWRRLDQPLEEPDGALMPGPRPSWLVRWTHPRPFPWEAWGRGNALMKLGMDRAAWREYRRALSEGGQEHPHLVQNVALVCLHLNRRQEARAWYRLLLAQDPGNEFARERLREL